jgi:hypothetical protein
MSDSVHSYSDDENIKRVWDVLAIKNLMGRRAYFHAYGMHEEEIDALWVALPENTKTASFGRNFGYQIGLDNIRHYYATSGKETLRVDSEFAAQSNLYIADDPGHIGIGAMAFHALTTPYIEISRDGKTAKGLWYSPGQITVAGFEGPSQVWIYAKYGADFMRELNQWKIWHLFIGTDFVVQPSTLMKNQPVPDTEARAIPRWKMTIEAEAYSSRHNWTTYPPIPVPYDTFDSAYGNGPEGNPKLRSKRL